MRLEVALRASLVIAFVLAACSTRPVSSGPAPDLRLPVEPVGCASGGRDGDETDVDCGGSCMPCESGRACQRAVDCASGVCTNAVCVAPACDDTVRNGAESDTDCGASCPHRCAGGQGCNDPSDCASGNCANRRCGPSLCANGQVDPGETDIDCGGPKCARCPGGRLCNEAADCSTGLCVNERCKADCPAGFDDCDGDAVNGCEVSSATDARHCGACGIVCPNNALICAGGRCQARISALLVAASAQQGFTDVQQKLMMTNSFTVVDVFDASVATPSVMQLLDYSAVLTWSEGSYYKDATALGDNLATYFDRGGRVVVAMFAFEDQPGLVLKGRFGNVANGYILFAPGRMVAVADMLGNIADRASPLMAGVKSLAADSAFATSGGVTNGGVVVASWASGTPLIARGSISGRRRVDLNLYPVSSSVDSTFWSGDGAALLRNALVY